MHSFLEAGGHLKINKFNPYKHYEKVAQTLMDLEEDSPERLKDCPEGLVGYARHLKIKYFSEQDSEPSIMEFMLGTD